ncbi:MAG: DUF2339 domain-containing protein, partial [Acidiferrobacterales bacterium]|nr:DUF2339 domain-containing protein [Acidiferrobacterales bacterium]
LLWLMLYTCLVCASAVAIYMYRGWRWLLVVTAAGGWSVLVHVWLEIDGIGYLPLADKAAYQAGVIACAALFGVVPAIRDVLVYREPDRWPVPASSVRLGPLVDRPALWLAVVSPLIAVALSRGVWDVDSVAWGGIEIVVATGYWSAYLFRRLTGDERQVVSAFGVTAGLILALAWFDLFDNPSWTLFMLAAEAGALLFVSKAHDDGPLRWLGHSIFAVAAMWEATRLTTVPDAPTLFALDSLGHMGVVAGLIAGGYLATSGGVRSLYRVAAMLLLMIAWASLFAGGSSRLLALGLQAAVVIVWFRLSDDRWLGYTGHFLFFALALALLQRTTGMSAQWPPLVNPASLADLFVIVVAAAISAIVEDRRAKHAYRFGAYVAFLLWFWRDLAPLDDGQAYVSIAWGAIAVALVVAGWRTDRDLVRQTGLATLGVVVLKMFAVDLSELDPLWRIVLFIGFGGLLLIVSYLFPSIWKGDADHNGVEESE